MGLYQTSNVKISKGIYAFYKPKGISSYDLIRKIKKRFSLKEKIGHAGTLDPSASGVSGVLVIAIGSKFTKKLASIVKKRKRICS